MKMRKVMVVLVSAAMVVGLFGAMTTMAGTGYVKKTYVVTKPVEVVPVAPAKTISIGDIGPEVEQLQTRLRDLGYYKYKDVDGFFGAYTEDAVMAFQADHAIWADGVVGQVTEDTLAAAKEAMTSGKAYEPEKQPEDLKVGVKVSTDVRDVQIRLAQLGYLDYREVDGYYGVYTEAAVKAFQEDNGLYVDGVVGAVTRSSLYYEEPEAPKPTVVYNIEEEGIYEYDDYFFFGPWMFDEFGADEDLEMPPTPPMPMF